MTALFDLMFQMEMEMTHRGLATFDNLETRIAGPKGSNPVAGSIPDCSTFSSKRAFEDTVGVAGHHGNSVRSLCLEIP